jgi:hypothetical protein
LIEAYKELPSRRGDERGLVAEKCLNRLSSELFSVIDALFHMWIVHVSNICRKTPKYASESPDLIGT